MRSIFSVSALPQAAALILAVVAPLSARAADPLPPITLEVDATDIARNLVHARLVIPASAGPLTLLYPKWIPGNHGPTGPIGDLAGLKIRAGDKTLEWQRDEVDPFSLSCVVTEGARAVEVSLDLLAGGSRSSSTAGTPQLGVVNWNQVLLYPKSPHALRLSVQASLRLPDGWQLGTALQRIPVKKNDGQVLFTPVTLETLIDSPVLCGAYLRQIPLGPDTEPRHFLVVACDSEAGMELPPETKKSYDRLIAETDALFGARHYRSYTFLLALSDRFRFSGLEHHESSDNRLPERAFLDAGLRKASAGLLPHEFVHSWNGKYRRPADMVTEDFQQPHRTKLLWVYEGLTHYLMFVLTARCGLWTPEEARDSLALVAEGMSNHKGRAWRPLEDTAVASHTLFDAARGWGAWRRSADYYDEGILLWLEVDTIIREHTKGKKSLDDFCRLFFGGASGPPTVKPYTLDDLAAVLNEVAPFDWKVHLTRRVTAIAEAAPLDGIRQSGWRPTHGDKPSALHLAQQGARKQIDLGSSLGLALGQDGAVADVIPGMAADKAGVGPGMKLVAVNGRRWSQERLNAAIAATKGGGKLELLFENGDFFRTYTLDYHDGPKYPRLERLNGDTPDLLSQILKPRVP